MLLVSNWRRRYNIISILQILLWLFITVHAIKFKMPNWHLEYKEGTSYIKIGPCPMHEVVLWKTRTVLTGDENRSRCLWEPFPFFLKPIVYTISTNKSVVLQALFPTIKMIVTVFRPFLLILGIRDSEACFSKKRLLEQCF